VSRCRISSDSLCEHLPEPRWTDTVISLRMPVPRDSPDIL
jgi:hypothetical protein